MKTTAWKSAHHTCLSSRAQIQKFIEEQQKILQKLIRTYSSDRTVFYTLFDTLGVLNDELEGFLGVQKIMTKQAGPPLCFIAGTYHTVPSHGFEGREEIFLKGLPTTIATATRSYLKRIFSPGTKWTPILTRNWSRLIVQQWTKVKELERAIP